MGDPLLAAGPADYTCGMQAQGEAMTEGILDRTNHRRGRKQESDTSVNRVPEQLGASCWLALTWTISAKQTPCARLILLQWLR